MIKKRRIWDICSGCPTTSSKRSTSF